jgi:hypothetical protein
MSHPSDARWRLRGIHHAMDRIVEADVTTSGHRSDRGTIPERGSRDNSIKPRIHDLVPACLKEPITPSGS